MKTRFPLLVLLPLVCMCRGLTGAEEATVSARFVDPTSPPDSERLTIGERTINRLAMTMVREVAGAGTPEGAGKSLDVCHLKALPSTGVVIKDEPRITAVKCTSLRLRNPVNAPDPGEQLALKRIEKDLEKGVVPKVLLQQIDLPTGKSEWRVYKPLGVLPQCAACHGPTENLPPDLQARLKERYPQDKANMFAAGNWRGLIRVTVADPPPPAPSSTKTTTSTKKKK